MISINPEAEGRAIAMRRLIPMSRQIASYINGVLPVSCHGGARDKFSDIQRELLCFEQTNAALGRSVGAASSQFSTLQAAFNQLKQKVTLCEQNKTRRWELRVIQFEIERLIEVLDQLKVSKENCMADSPASGESATWEFVAEMMNTLVGGNDATKKQLQSEIEAADIKVEEEKLSRSKLHENWLKRQSQLETKQSALKHLLEEQSLAENRLFALRKEYGLQDIELQNTLQEKARILTKHANDHRAVRQNSAGRRAKILMKTDAELSVLTAKKKVLQGDLLTAELAQLGLQPPKGSHFILAGDRSGSMYGPRWLALLESLRKFGEAVVTGDNTFSLLLFDHEAFPVAQDQSMSHFPESVKKVEQFPPTRGGTNFTAAWTQIKLTAEAARRDRQTVILFMTDGSSGTHDIQSAGVLAQDLYSSRSGQVWTFAIPCDVGDPDFLTPIVLAGNGGKQSVVCEDGTHISCSNPTDLQSLPIKFTEIKAKASQNVVAIKAAFDKHMVAATQDLQEEQKEEIERTGKIEQKRLVDIEAVMLNDLELCDETIKIIQGSVEAARAKLPEAEAAFEAASRKAEDVKSEANEAIADLGSIDVHNAEVDYKEQAVTKAQKHASSKRETLDDLAQKEIDRGNKGESNWFQNNEEMWVVHQLLTTFLHAKEVQKDIKEYSREMFDKVYGNLKTLAVELRAPNTCTRTRKAQAQDVLNHFQGKCADSGPENVVKLQQSVIQKVCEDLTLPNRTVDIQKAVHFISSFVPFEELIFVVEPDSEDSEQKQNKKWMADLRSRFREKLTQSGCVSQKVKVAKARVDKNEDKARRLRGRISEEYDDDVKRDLMRDLKDVEKDLEEGQSEFAEHSGELGEYEDILGFVITTIDSVLDVSVRQVRLQETLDAIAKFDFIFEDSVQRYCRGASAMTLASMGGNVESASIVWAPGGSRDDRVKMLNDLKIIPGGCTA